MTVYEREVTRARTGFLAAVRRLGQAMESFERARVPLTPGPDGAIPAWTPEQSQVVKACATAWADLARARRDFDGAMRSLHPKNWPH